MRYRSRRSGRSRNRRRSSGMKMRGQKIGWRM